MFREDQDRLIAEMEEQVLRCVVGRIRERDALAVATDLVDTATVLAVDATRRGDRRTIDGAAEMRHVGQLLAGVLKSRKAQRLALKMQRAVWLKSRPEPSPAERIARFYEMQRAQIAASGWLSPSEQREADQESQRRLDAIVEGQRREQEAELARIRAHEEAAAAEERPLSWRERHGGRRAPRDPLRG